VGYIIDDIDLSGIGGIATTFDLQQVDVLRGPQSARYGSSALAGIIYQQSAMPTDEFSGKLELTGGSEETWSVGAAVGGPLSANIGGRVSVHNYEDDGFRNNQFKNAHDTNNREELTVRGKLSFDFANGWNALLSGLYADYDNGYDAFSIQNNQFTGSDEPGKDKQKTKAGSLKLSGPLNAAIDLVSITSYADSDITFSYDADWENRNTFLSDDYEVAYSSDNLRERDTFSQEFRLVSGAEGRLFNDTTDWVLGVYYQNLDEDNDLTNLGDYTDYLDRDNYGCTSPGFCVSERSVQSDFESDTYALFAATETALTSKLGLSVGLRYERWEADYKDTWLDTGVFPVPLSGTYKYAPDDNMVGGHVALSYAWDEDLRGYGRIARGFKAGGFNPSLNAFADNGIDDGQYGAELAFYDPEYLWNYEVGLKTLWLAGALSADISVFYMDRDDAQLSQSDQLRDDPDTPETEGDPAAFIFTTYNGEAKSYGLEASVAWQATTSWQFFSSLGWMNTEIDQWEVRPEVEGRDLAHAPSYTLNVGALWSGPAGWYGRVDVNAVDEYYFDISHDEKSDSYELVNLRLGKGWDNWDVSLWVRNAFDKDYATRGFYFANEPPYAQDELYTRFGDPRQAGVTLKYGF
jgi:iron complex outermembrane receptor protein